MLRGSLDDFTLPDIFRLMSFAKKTGRLGVTRSAGAGKVYFRDGEVYFAESSLSKEPLGQKLVRSRALTEGQLMKALDEHKASGERLGAVLVRLGIVTPDQLENAIRQQIEDAAFDLLRWELGDFDWEPGEEMDIEIPIRVSVENLIMEASRRLDEFEVIKRKIPSGDSVLGMASTPPEGAVEINITPEEWRILVLVDGDRTVAQIGQMVGLDEFAAMRVLYGLVSAGLIELVGEGPATEVDHEAPAEVATEVDLAVPAEPVATVVAEEAVDDTAPEAEPEASAEADIDIDIEIEPGAVVGPEAIVAPEVIVAPEPEDMVAPEPVAAFEPETVEEPATEDFSEGVAEPVADVDAEPVVDTDGLIEAEPLVETEPLVAPDPSDSGILPDEAVAAADAAYAPRVEELTPEELEQFGFTPASATTDAWGDSTTVESFDAPAPDELVTETPGPDPFVADLYADSTAGPAAPESPIAEPFSDETVGQSTAPAPPAPAPPEEIPVSSAPEGDAPTVDRAAVVRELAGLFSEEATPRTRPAASRPKPAASGGDAASDPDDKRKRVEDDEDVTKGIISRLIDGVKGL